jgi:hypothetical protein
MARRNQSKREKRRRQQRQRTARPTETARTAAPAAVPATAPTAAFPDPRLWTVEVIASGGVPVTEPTFIFPVDRLRLNDGHVLALHAVAVPAFYLLTAKELRDRGEPERLKTMETIRPSPSDTGSDMDVSDDSLATDALGRLASAVILSVAAIEAYANEAIDRLDPAATVTIERRGDQVEVPQSELVRRLSLDEKLDLVAPLVSGRASIKGTRPWELFKKLNELRGEVVHVKARGRTDDPDIPSALGRLLLGEGSSCIEDAAAVINACDPGWLPEPARRALGIG